MTLMPMRIFGKNFKENTGKLPCCYTLQKNKEFFEKNPPKNR